MVNDESVAISRTSKYAGRWPQDLRPGKSTYRAHFTDDEMISPSFLQMMSTSDFIRHASSSVLPANITASAGLSLKAETTFVLIKFNNFEQIALINHPKILPECWLDRLKIHYAD